MGAYQKSVAYSKKAYEIGKKIGRIKIVQEATEIQYKAYKQMGRHEPALQFLEITQSLNDSLIQVQKIADLENLRKTMK